MAEGSLNNGPQTARFLPKTVTNNLLFFLG